MTCRFGKDPRDNRNIVVDMYPDAVSVDIVKPDAAVDFDSLAWVTHHLKFLAVLSIFNIPPPDAQNWHIKTDNHIKVRLIAPPQVGADPLDGQYLEPPTSLCKIPHILLGQLGNCEKKIYLFVFFPRMLHRSKSATPDSYLPYGTQKLLWDHVIIPAIAACRHTGQDMQTPASVDEQHDKHGRNASRFSLISPNDVDRFVATMRKIIHVDPKLQIFGSFFYLVEGRGFKGLTTQVLKSTARRQQEAKVQRNRRREEAKKRAQESQRCLTEIKEYHARQNSSYRGDTAAQPRSRMGHMPATTHRLVPDVCPELSVDEKTCWEMLWASIPLDPDYMQSTGELFLDLAVSFHPPDAYVGVWDPGALMHTFRKAGIKKPTVYYKNTLKDAVALTGCPEPSVSAQTGIIYCQAYIGAFEKIRSYNRNYDFFSESDAAQNTKAFFTEVDKLINICESQLASPDQPKHAADYQGRFGVRIEYRMTVASAKDLVHNCLWQVGGKLSVPTSD